MPRVAHSWRASATSRAKSALVGPGGGSVGDQPHALELDRDVGDRERHGLPVEIGSPKAWRSLT